MAYNFISKGDADDARTKQTLKDLETEVLFENRFGRQIWVRMYDAKKFVRRMEGNIIPNTTRPLRGEGWARSQRRQAKAEASTPQSAPKTQANTDRGDELTLDQAHAKYQDKFGRIVPNNKKNDLQWIISKITS